MNEKDMVNDILSQTNSSLATYADIIAQAENLQFRQTIQTIRDDAEQFQYQLFKCAQSKQYYEPAEPANPHQIQHVKSLFEN